MAVNKLGEGDRGKTLSFLERESALNLFLIGDIVNFGFGFGFQELWGDFDGRGELRGVLLRYFGSWIPYATWDFDVDGFAAVIASHGQREMLSGIDRVTDRFRGIEELPFDWGNLRQTYFAELTEAGFRDAADPHPSASFRRMEAADAARIMELTRGIGEFTVRPTAESMLAQSLEAGDSRGYWVEDGGRAVAMARTAAENPASAMVIGVGTLDEYRNRGLATLLMIRLCREVLSEGKRLCLFYDNPRAGVIYKRLGFRDIGMWNMVEAR